MQSLVQKLTVCLEQTHLWGWAQREWRWTQPWKHLRGASRSPVWDCRPAVQSERKRPWRTPVQETSAMTWGQLKRGPACHCRQPTCQGQGQGRWGAERQDRGQAPPGTSQHPAKTWETPPMLFLGAQRLAQARAVTDAAEPTTPSSHRLPCPPCGCQCSRDTQKI